MLSLSYFSYYKCSFRIKYLGFLIIDVLNNVDDLSENDIESLLLQKENFWIGTLVTEYKGLNGSHDWNRHQRIHRDM